LGGIGGGRGEDLMHYSFIRGGYGCNY
jgi:hypothetical protein